MNHHVKCFAIVVVILPVERNYFVPTKIGCFQNFFPGLQEPAILETDYVMVIIFVYFPHTGAPPWAAEPPVHTATGTAQGRGQAGNACPTVRAPGWQPWKQQDWFDFVPGVLPCSLRSCTDKTVLVLRDLEL